MKNPQGPPLDYSFLELADIEELRLVMPVSGQRKCPPETIRDKTGQEITNPLLGEWKKAKPQEGLVTQGIKLGNNEIKSIPFSFSYIVREIMEKPQFLRWVDLSFNQLEEIPAVLGCYAHLSSIYLHANRIAKPSQIKVLAGLQELRSLTLHGNPCEKVSNYRLAVAGACKGLKKLDFTTITKADRDKASLYRAAQQRRRDREKEKDVDEGIKAPTHRLQQGIFI